jgi:hypothetical protein
MAIARLSSVGGGAADEGDVDRDRLVEQPLLAVDFHHPNQLLGGARVELAARQARIDEGAEADARQVPGLAGGDVAVQMRDHALRQVVGGDPVVHRERTHLRDQAPVAADDARQQALAAESVQAALAAIALAGGEEQGQAGRLLLGVEALGQRRQQLIGRADADEARGGERVAGPHQRGGLGGGDDLVAHGR